VSGSSNTTCGGIFRPLVPPPGALLWRMLEPRPHATDSRTLVDYSERLLTFSLGSISHLSDIYAHTHTHTHTMSNRNICHCMSLFTGHHVSGVKYITSLKSYLCTAVTRREQRRKLHHNSEAQDTTALKYDVFLTGIEMILVIHS
jgi:hypothetical protein